MLNVKNIVCTLFVLAIIYGMVEMRSIAYCCGHCHIDELTIAEDKHDCCEDGDSSTPEDHDCEGKPCQVTSFDSDWEASPTNSTLSLPDLPVFNVLFPVNLTGKSNHHFTFLDFAKRGSPFLLPTPREYLSQIRILLI